MAVIKPPGGSGVSIAASGWVAIEDIDVPSGTVSSRLWQDGPNNTILQSATVSGTGIDVTVRSSYPLVTVNGTPATLTPAADGGHYEGTVSITIAGSGTISVNCLTANNTVGAEDDMAVTLSAPPVLLTLSFTGGYPGAQTELKEDDQFSITLTADKNFDQVEVIDFEAGKTKIIPVAPTSSATVAIDIANRGNTVAARFARVRVRDAITGANSATRDTDELGGTVDGTDLVNVNNFAYAVTLGTPTYPASQQALKAAESSTVTSTNDYAGAPGDTALWDSPGAELSIPSPTIIGASKVVSRLGGTYNVSVDNLRITLFRAANANTTVVQRVVQIADVAPTIDITLPAARLRSGGNHGTVAQDHSVQINSSQLLAGVPSLVADAGGNRGTFQGGGFTGAGATWNRDLRVDEVVPDEKGTFAFASLVATGLAGLVQNTINSGASYTLGGFVPRTLNFAPFTANSTEAVVVADETKLASGSFSNGNPGVRQPFGTADTADVGKEGWFAPTAASGTVNIRMLHTGMVAANSAGLTLASLEETV